MLLYTLCRGENAVHTGDINDFELQSVWKKSVFLRFLFRLYGFGAMWGRQNSAYLEFFMVIFVTVGDFGDISILDKNLYHQIVFSINRKH